MVKRILTIIGSVGLLVLLLIGVQQQRQTIRVDEPMIVYLGWDEQEQSQLFTIGLSDDVPQQITQSTTEIIDFAVAPNGQYLVYSRYGAASGSEIWQVGLNGRSPQRLLTCLQALCNQVVWASDSQRLVYERRQQDSPDDPLAAAYLWWLDSQTGETLPLTQENHIRASAVRFSADSSWLSYYTPEKEGIYAYHFDSQESFFVSSHTGQAAAWHPDSGSLLVTDYNLVVTHGDDGQDHLNHEHSYQEGVHLFRFDLSSRRRTLLTADIVIDDGFPTWSPDGEWVAFSRTLPRTSVGRQLWLMRPDGSEARALTDAPTIHHGPPAWSADGRFLLHQQFELYQSGTEPSIWLLDVANGKQRLIASPGIQPAWAN